MPWPRCGHLKWQASSWQQQAAAAVGGTRAPRTRVRAAALLAAAVKQAVALAKVQVGEQVVVGACGQAGAQRRERGGTGAPAGVRQATWQVGRCAAGDGPRAAGSPSSPARWQSMLRLMPRPLAHTCAGQAEGPTVAGCKESSRHGVPGCRDAGRIRGGGSSSSSSGSSGSSGSSSSSSSGSDAPCARQSHRQKDRGGRGCRWQSCSRRGWERRRRESQ